MSIISRMKKQTCIHWSRMGVSGTGRPTFAGPVEKTCRWEERNEKYLTPSGEERMSRALVYVGGVKVGDVLMEGSLDDSGINLTDPFRNAGAWEVQRYDSCPNLKASETLYTAYL